MITKKQLNDMKESVQTDVDRAFEFAEESPFPNPEEAFVNLYAE